MKHATVVPPATTDSAQAYVRLQRRCACGSGAKENQCEECHAKAAGLQAKLAIGAADDAFEREADAIAARVMSGGTGAASTAPLAVQRVARRPSAAGPVEMAPAQVEQVIASAGQPLDDRTRAFFEPRFGHDFRRVRIHGDSAAARSAAQVRARAYTVGEHVVFGSGQYAPNSVAGRALLAHELTHVLQQRSVVQRRSIMGEPRAEGLRKGEDEDAREHAAATVQRSRLWLQRLDWDDFPGGWPEKDEAEAIRTQDRLVRECLKSAPADKAECDPDRALDWTDFADRNVRSGFSAQTSSDLREREINIADRRCKPPWAPADQPARGVQAFFDPAGSWVRREAGRQAGDPAVNGCATIASDCRADFARGNTGFRMDPGPVPGCAASVRAAGTRATTADECTTVVGADCNATRLAESARLLNHEQWHFKLTCEMAKKANAMLATTPDFDALLAAARRTLNAQQRLYDNQTNHGCNAGAQSRWQADISAGLPAVTITVQAPAAPRRRR
ncbi:MAG TPA: DUF4157 domain-containing protein [Ottowia sp.]|uniref:eCIS core domain-containing protein n=1 Tax=Ottowia sp. TaxID=1898956 RepID=UPI002CB68FA7|nr:DUF4157 domain-containing protein [Ottowia sp.]HMN20305.1 DUF4157 domain-containing protein [Ottowia sp.]